MWGEAIVNMLRKKFNVFKHLGEIVNMLRKKHNKNNDLARTESPSR